MSEEDDDEEIDEKQKKKEEESATSAEFLLLRPLCIKIMKESPTLENLDKFQTALSLIVNHPSSHLAQYVLLPFALHLKRLSTFK